MIRLMTPAETPHFCPFLNHMASGGLNPDETFLSPGPGNGPTVLPEGGRSFDTESATFRWKALLGEGLASATIGSKPIWGPDRTCGGLKWNMRDWKYVFVGICSGLEAIFPKINCEARCANEAVGDTITIR